MLKYWTPYSHQGIRFSVLTVRVHYSVFFNALHRLPSTVHHARGRIRQVNTELYLSQVTVVVIWPSVQTLVHMYSQYRSIPLLLTWCKKLSSGYMYILSTAHKSSAFFCSSIFIWVKCYATGRERYTVSQYWSKYHTWRKNEPLARCCMTLLYNGSGSFLEIYYCYYYWDYYELSSLK